MQPSPPARFAPTSSVPPLTTLAKKSVAQMRYRHGNEFTTQRTTSLIVRISQMIVMWKSRRRKRVSAAADLRERENCVAGGEVLNPVNRAG